MDNTVNDLCHELQFENRVKNKNFFIKQNTFFFFFKQNIIF